MITKRANGVLKLMSVEEEWASAAICASRPCVVIGASSECVCVGVRPTLRKPAMVKGACELFLRLSLIIIWSFNYDYADFGQKQKNVSFSRI